jgi:hypothetical protein
MGIDDDGICLPPSLASSLAVIVINVETDLALLARLATAGRSRRDVAPLIFPLFSPLQLLKAGRNFLRIMNVSGYLRLRWR